MKTKTDESVMPDFNAWAHNMLEYISGQIQSIDCISDSLAQQLKAAFDQGVAYGNLYGIKSTKNFGDL